MGRISDRIARFRANNGPLGSVWNVAVLVFICYRVWTTGDPFVRAIMGGLVLVALTLGWLIVPIGRMNIRFASRLLSVLNWIIIGMIVVSLTGMMVFPGLVWLAAVATLVWIISAEFWLTSEPGVMTGYSVQKMQREQRRDAMRRGEI